MSKKHKRQVSRPSALVTNEVEAPVAQTRSSVAARAEFNPDYSYVLSDLRRIVILAVSFFAVLVILSFILD